MRALEVLGLAEDGAHLVCHDATTGEEFALPADERLTAAARGDVTRLGQLEIEMESQLRPKEIQARIRAGASVAEVAAAAGSSAAKIERFAYPVLMERSAIADRATTAHPVGPAGPAALTIAEVVADTLQTRGHSGPVEWDAFKAAGAWVLVVRWRAGRSQNAAHFTYHPGPGGGTVVPADETAGELLDPAPKPLRTVRAADSAGQEPDLLGVAETQRLPRVTAAASGDDDAAHTGPRDTGNTAADATGSGDTDHTASDGDSGGSGDNDAADRVAEMVEDERAGVHPRPEHREQIARTGTDHVSAHPAGKARGGRSGKPAMPSWDDVLLGSGVRKR